MKKLIPLLMLPAVAVAERPNIVYIFTDQQTASAMSCAGNADVQTPNMDRLAEMGVRFVNAYCSSPLSGPSRSAMFTGYTPSETGLMKNGTPMNDSLPATTLGVLLSEAGYECAYAGKWHVHTATIPDGEFGFKCLHEHNDYGLAESVVDFLNQPHGKPFFLVAGFDNPHNICEYARGQSLPFTQMEEPDLAECPGLPANFSVQPYDAEVVRIEQSLRFRTYPVVHYSADDWRRYRNAYFHMVETVDKQIGQILDVLDAKNLWKNTVVIFSSDHGDGTGAHRWNQKSALYEEVTNIPFMVVSPKNKKGGQVFPQLINNGVDFYISVCDWAEVVVPAGRYGQSFRALVEKGNAETPHQPYVVTETQFDQGDTKGWQLRTAKYKYVLYDKGRYREQLYDMETDRGEMRNLAVEKQFADVLKQHRALLSEWMELHHVADIRPGLKHVPQ